MKRALTVVKIGVILIIWWLSLTLMATSVEYILNHLPYAINCVIETAHISLCYIIK